VILVLASVGFLLNQKIGTKGPAWGNPRGLRIRPAGDNVFVAVFTTCADRDRVLEGTPWMVGRHAVLLQPHDPRLRPSDVRFDSMTIWVRILNLPFEWMNNKKGLKIAKLIDKNCSVDVDEFGVASGTFLRDKVAIPFDQPLRRWVIIRHDGHDESSNMQYENILFFCLVVASSATVSSNERALLIWMLWESSLSTEI
jgi:hypothetical protein